MQDSCNLYVVGKANEMKKIWIVEIGDVYLFIDECKNRVDVLKCGCRDQWCACLVGDCIQRVMQQLLDC